MKELFFLNTDLKQNHDVLKSLNCNLFAYEWVLCFVLYLFRTSLQVEESRFNKLNLNLIMYIINLNEIDSR